MPNGKVRKRRQSRIADAKSPASWADREVADCEFKDERLGKRFRSRLSSCPRVRVTAFLWSARTAGAYRDGMPRYLTACGIMVHSSLAVTADGLPLGLTAIKFWSRKKFKDENALKRKINPTRVPIEEKESIRWLDNLKQSTILLGDAARCVHIGDRESDIYELFCTAHDAGTQFLLRTCVDRLAGDGGDTIATEMAEVDCKGLHRIEVRDRHGNISEATLELKFRRILVQPPLYKQRRYPALELTVLHATEQGKPRGRDPIDWKLITNLPVTSRAQAIEKLQWYALRWRIEVFHCASTRTVLGSIESVGAQWMSNDRFGFPVLPTAFTRSRNGRSEFPRMVP